MLRLLGGQQSAAEEREEGQSQKGRASQGASAIADHLLPFL
jgi:hypothetical protein